MVTVLTKKGITATLADTNIVASGYYADGNPWVRVSGNVTISSYTPAKSGSGATLRNGAMKNVRGQSRVWLSTPHDETNSGNFVARHGMDGRDATGVVYDASLTVATPITCAANDVIIIAKSNPNVTTTFPDLRDRPSYLNNQGRSWIDEMMAITFVGGGANPAANALRPNAIGDPAQRMFKTEDDINWANLPAFVDTAQITALGVTSIPSLAYLKNVFSDFCGEIMDGWQTDPVTPDLQHPGYGRTMGAMVSQAGVRCVCTDDQTNRRILARMLIQWGIDLWGAWRDGRLIQAGGGHGNGRKALIVFGGHMLGDSAMRNPDATLGLTHPFPYQLEFADGRFMERSSFFEGPQFHGGRFGWCHHTGPGDNDYQATPPNTWPGSVGAQGTKRWEYNGYMVATSEASVGQVFFMLAIGRGREWSPEGVGWMEHFMSTTQAWKDAFIGTGINVSECGDDWAIGGIGQGFCSAAWNLYRYKLAAGPSIKSFQGNTFVLAARGVGVQGRPVLTTQDVPNWGTTVKFEILNAPTNATRTSLVFGTLAVGPAMTITNPLVLACYNATSGGVVNPANPSAYGYLVHAQQIPSLVDAPLIPVLGTEIILSTGTATTNSIKTFGSALPAAQNIPAATRAAQRFGVQAVFHTPTGIVTSNAIEMVLP